MTINNITDLIAWQEARKLCQEIYILTKKFPPEEKFIITKHLRESARGVMANLAEGFGRYFFRESLKFYGISRGCLEEVRSDLYLALDNNYINEEEFNYHLAQVNMVSALINGLIPSTNKRLNLNN